MKVFLVGMVAVFTLTCCAQMEWVNSSKNENDFYTDKYKCEQQSANAYPASVTNIPYTNGTQQPTVTNCTGNSYGNGNGYSNANVNCTSTPGAYTPPATILVDTNANNRNEAFSSCMYSNGWRLQQKGKQIVRTQNQYN
jgi:hypothetical protein